jgi:MFS family permease
LTLAAAALSAVLFGSITFIWPLGFAAALASPLPMAFVGWRTTPVRAFGALALAAASLAALLGPGIAFEYLTQFGLAGLFLGHGIKNRWSPQLVIGSYVACGLLGFTALIGMEAVSAGVTPLELVGMLSTEWTSPLRQALLVGELDAETLAATELMLDQMEKVVVAIPFGLIAGIGLFTAWINAMVFRRLLTIRGYTQQRWTDWSAPEFWVWGLIAAGAMTLVGDNVALVGYNLLIPMVMVYFLQGMAIIQNLFEARSAPRMMRTVLYALIFLQLNTMVIFVAVAGAFDQWLDYRTKLAPQADTTETN